MPERVKPFISDDADDWGGFMDSHVPQGFKGHVWETDEGQVDLFATSGGYCNGPRCVNCGVSFCMHCTPPKKVGYCPKSLNGPKALGDGDV